MTNEHRENLVKRCGAVAVSCYDKDVCFDEVEKLSAYIDRPGYTIKQVNIHQVLAKETYSDCLNLVNAVAVHMDKRVDKLGAVVFLWIKPKGKRNTYTQLDFSTYKIFVNYMLEVGMRFGFDSCSAPMFIKAVEKHKDIEKFMQMAESCESTCFSYYINAEGLGFPCSFSEKVNGYNGVDIEKAEDFIKDVWYHPETVRFREANIKSCDSNLCRNCTVYKLG
jgi:hypothetical protein